MGRAWRTSASRRQGWRRQKVLAEWRSWWRWQNEAAIEAAAAGEAAKEAAVNEASEMPAKAWAADATAAAVRRKPLRQKRLRARDGGEEEMAVRLCER